MAIVRPAITGDIVQDSWADQVTRALNSGAFGGGGGDPFSPTSSGSGTGPSGIDGFSAATLYLFRRTTTNTPPADITVATTYTYSTGILTGPGGNTGDPDLPDDDIDGWYRAIPDTGDGYTWVIVVNIADQGDSETIAASSWTSVALLSQPGQDAVTVFVEARSPDNASADWVSLSNTSNASPNFKNDTSKVIGLVIHLYEAGVEVANSVYTDSTTSYVWTKNGEDFTPEETQDTGTGKDMRVLLINEQDVADGNFNEVFTCVIDY